MNQSITTTRIIGGTLLLTLIFAFITAAISGSDTSADGFGGELARITENGDTADAGNAIIRAIAGFGTVIAGGVLFAALRERSAYGAAILGLTIGAAGALSLVAGAIHIVLVDVADQYVAANGERQDDLLLLGRTLALVTANISGASALTTVAAFVAMAGLVARERLAPRGLVALPALGSLGLVSVLIWSWAGSDSDGGWFLFMASVMAIALWALITGLWLLFSSDNDNDRAPAAVEPSRRPALS